MHWTVILGFICGILPVLVMTAYSADRANTIDREVERRLARGEKANRLIATQSPYLLQHAFNPVDWYPWGMDAFARAAGEDKPIFHSIGYSTCHWCHVMAHESFEDPETAELLNTFFVSIKVEAILDRTREKLLTARQLRSRPHLDDKVITSWNGMMVGTLAKSSRILGDPKLLDEAVRTASFIRKSLPLMLTARLQAGGKASQIIIAGRQGASETNALLDVAYSSPTSLVLLADGGENQSYLAEKLPFFENVMVIDNKATAYVCSDFTCRLPVTDPGLLRIQLGEQQE